MRSFCVGNPDCVVNTPTATTTTPKDMYICINMRTYTGVSGTAHVQSLGPGNRGGGKRLGRVALVGAACYGRRP